jgi:hypothetical protein
MQSYTATNPPRHVWRRFRPFHPAEDCLLCEEIANMAGISRETVTRLLSQFRRDRWIAIGGSSLTIVKPEQLERPMA